MPKITRAIVPLLCGLWLTALLAGCTAERAQTGEGTDGKTSTQARESAQPEPAPAPPKVESGSNPPANAEPTVAVAEKKTEAQPAEDPAKVGPWDLKVRFKKGETHTYTIKSDSSVRVSLGQGDPMPPQQMTDEATVAVKALEANDKSAKVQYTVTSKAKKGEEQEKPLNLVVSLDSRGNAKVEGESKDPRERMMASLPVVAIHCPDRPVKLNDTWTASIQHPLKALPQLAMAGLKVADTLKVSYKLVGVTDKGLKVRASAGDKIAMEVKKGQSGSPGPGHLNISLQFTMDYVVDPKTAQVLSASIVQASKSSAEQTMGEGKTVKQSSDAQTKVTLKRTK